MSLPPLDGLPALPATSARAAAAQKRGNRPGAAMALMTRLEREAYDAMTVAERRAFRDARRDRTGRAPRDQTGRDRGDRREYLPENIAVLDFETDPGDAASDASIAPFLAVLYSDQFTPVTIWDDDPVSFVHRVIVAIEALPAPYTVYAHNGGKFDYMFLLHRLRGQVIMKGRGLMEAKIGKHRLRDSFHILPVALRTFEKDDFDYGVLAKDKRHEHRETIIKYCTNDCRYLFDVVKHFVAEYGFKLTIGQASLTIIKTTYEFDRLNESMDANFRRFFHGGRVECLSGAGEYFGTTGRPWRMYDVNSMYPFAMASYQHPHRTDEIAFRGRGMEPGPHTQFVRLTCTNCGAFMAKVAEPTTKAGRMQKQAWVEAGHVDGGLKRGEFFVTIHEYLVAIKYGLIDDVEFLECVDFGATTNFAAFIEPLYARREILKAWLDSNDNLVGTEDYKVAYRQSIFLKLLMNNGYGKFAQNPDKFCDRYLTDIGELPPNYADISDWTCDEFPNAGYAIWETPVTSKRYNNVAVGASITGAARSILLDAIHKSIDPIYCDTDSLICRDLPGVDLHASRLGAWDLEAEFHEVVICGKKLYAARNLVTAKQKYAHKGAPKMPWNDYLKMIQGESIKTASKVPTINKDGSQRYQRREIQVTARRNKRTA